ncbi:small ribosomal subunit protein mS22 [Panulirus ornatus]|uniref:small ribosomal subunit protein mS22 n=1 Tax=Panulirus ornatus TaxID=150431 RepID=UPI003A850786
MESGVRSMSPLLRVILRRNLIFRDLYAATSRRCSVYLNVYNDRDPAPIFFDKTVQDILKRVAGMDLKKVFKQRLDEKELKPPRYEFFTHEELQAHMEDAKKKAWKILQMPPVLKERQPIKEVLSKDPALTGYDTCKHVFTDITYGLSDRKRLIVVRDLDGTLRQASWEERDRLNQVYFPQPGRKLTRPKIFLEENFKDVLERQEYEFVLERACAQFEPDDPEYHRITSRVYEAIEANRLYHMLLSTRHYGPLCFYLAWHKKIDNLLVSLIQNERLESCADIVRLYQLIHTDCKSVALNLDPQQHLEFVKAYVEHDALQQPQLQLAIQVYQDMVQEQQEYHKDIKKAHGV